MANHETKQLAGSVPVIRYGRYFVSIPRGGLVQFRADYEEQWQFKALLRMKMRQQALEHAVRVALRREPRPFALGPGVKLKPGSSGRQGVD